MSLKDLFEEAFRQHSKPVDDFDIANGEYLQEALALLGEAGLRAEIASVTGDAVYMRVQGDERKINEWVGLRYELRMDIKKGLSCFFHVTESKVERNIGDADGRRALAADIVTYVAARHAMAAHQEALAKVFAQSVFPQDAMSPGDVRFAAPEENALKNAEAAPLEEKLLQSVVRVMKSLNAGQSEVAFALKPADKSGEFYLSFTDARRPAFYGSMALTLERGPFYKGFAPQVRIGWREKVQTVRGERDEAALRDIIVKRVEKDLAAFDMKKARENNLRM